MNKLCTLGTVALAVVFAGPAGAQPMTVQAPPGGIDVNVVNPPDSPVPVRDVDRQARIPVVDACTAIIDDGDTSAACLFQDVEVGKRLVVEFISGRILYPNGQTAQVTTLIDRIGGGFSQNHFLLQTLQRVNIDGNDWYVVSQPFRIYVQGGARLGVDIARFPYDTGSVTGRFRITGYLVDVDEEE